MNSGKYRQWQQAMYLHTLCSALPAQCMCNCGWTAYPYGLQYVLLFVYIGCNHIPLEPSPYIQIVFAYFMWQTLWYAQWFWYVRWSLIKSFIYCSPQQSHTYNGASTVVRQYLLFPQWATKNIVITRPGS
jgi:hypothetical protein